MVSNETAARDRCARALVTVIIVILVSGALLLPGLIDSRDRILTIAPSEVQSMMGEIFREIFDRWQVGFIGGVSAFEVC